MTAYLAYVRVTQIKMIVEADDSWKAQDVALAEMHKRLEGLYEGGFVEVLRDPEAVDYGPCQKCGQPLNAHGEGLGQVTAAGCARVAALPPEKRR